MIHVLVGTGVAVALFGGFVAVAVAHAALAKRIGSDKATAVVSIAAIFVMVSVMGGMMSSCMEDARKRQEAIRAAQEISQPAPDMSRPY